MQRIRRWMFRRRRLFVVRRWHRYVAVRYRCTIIFPWTYSWTAFCCKIENELLEIERQMSYRTHSMLKQLSRFRRSFLFGLYVVSTAGLLVGCCWRDGLIITYWSTLAVRLFNWPIDVVRTTKKNIRTMNVSIDRIRALIQVRFGDSNIILKDLIARWKAYFWENSKKNFEKIFSQK